MQIYGVLAPGAGGAGDANLAAGEGVIDGGEDGNGRAIEHYMDGAGAEVSFQADGASWGGGQGVGEEDGLAGGDEMEVDAAGGFAWLEVKEVEMVGIEVSKDEPEVWRCGVGERRFRKVRGEAEITDEEIFEEGKGGAFRPMRGGGWGRKAAQRPTAGSCLGRGSS